MLHVSAVTRSFSPRSCTQRAASCCLSVVITDDLLELSATPGSVMKFLIRVVYPVALSKVTSSKEEDNTIFCAVRKEGSAVTCSVELHDVWQKTGN